MQQLPPLGLVSFLAGVQVVPGPGIHRYHLEFMGEVLFNKGGHRGDPAIETCRIHGRLDWERS